MIQAKIKYTSKKYKGLFYEVIYAYCFIYDNALL